MDGHFKVDDLLDFSQENEFMTDAYLDTSAGYSGDSNTLNSGENVSCGSFNQFSGGGELCVPCDDLAELEWLSNFVDESFSSETFSAVTALAPPRILAVPGKARSKRPRAAPCDWSSRILAISPKAAPFRRRETPGRRCLHCASEKTPQWRTGPAGPKTLCNACGVRYKLGRLVPEYRPASSPSFVPARHSNLHRKVLELRRQKGAVRCSTVAMGS